MCVLDFVIHMYIYAYDLDLCALPWWHVISPLPFAPTKRKEYQKPYSELRSNCVQCTLSIIQSLSLSVLGYMSIEHVMAVSEKGDDLPVPHVQYTLFTSPQPIE
jgi:hypothetical protein